VVQKILEFSFASECNETVLSGLTDGPTFGPMSLSSKESTEWVRDRVWEITHREKTSHLRTLE